MDRSVLPQQQGLYDPRFEHDSCGVGFVCHVKGRQSHDIVAQGLEILRRLSHRGATGADPKTGDGAGVLIQIPHEFLVEKCLAEGIQLPVPGKYGTGPYPPLPTLWKSFRNDLDHRSDNSLKLTDLKSESVISFIPES